MTIIAFFLIFLVLISSSLVIGKNEEKKPVSYLSDALKSNVLGLPPVDGYKSFDTKPFMNDVIIPADYMIKQYKILADQVSPSSDQNAMFMIGKISVSIIFMESNGTIDMETENWSDARVSDYVNRIQSGLNWLKTQQSNVRINLTFHTQTIGTSYEPINRSQTDDSLWINESMSSLGYNFGEWHERVTNYNNDLRTADKTHWAYTIFVIDSYNDPDGSFSNGISDYMAGPYIVMTYDNGGWNVTSTNKAVAHETAHEFGAADEYYINNSNPAYCSCSGAYGFLQVPNSNCVAGCTNKGGYIGCGGCNACYTSNCLMENLNLCLTNSSKHQLGWRDNDTDGIWDAMDSTYNSWTDTDLDGVVDYLDNCPNTANKDQKDTDNDWIGDVCDIEITILSPENTGYRVFRSYYELFDKIPLNFTVNKPVSWMGYSLDNKPNVTITGNTSLAITESGSHNIVVYVKDPSGNTGVSEKRYFNVTVKNTCYKPGLCWR